MNVIIVDDELAGRRTLRELCDAEGDLTMREDILKGSIRVLEKYGAHRFTTIRVAEETGVSVGSLYQYFPNKESLLFALHEHRK